MLHKNASRHNDLPVNDLKVVSHEFYLPTITYYDNYILHHIHGHYSQAHVGGGHQILKRSVTAMATSNHVYAVPWVAVDSAVSVSSLIMEPEFQ